MGEVGQMVYSGRVEKTSRKTASGRFMFSCKVCGKEGKSGDIKNHIEAIHLEGVSVPCNNCEITFGSRNSLAKYVFRIHKNNTYYQDQRFFEPPQD